jgi:hypothetical protein
VVRFSRDQNVVLLGFKALPPMNENEYRLRAQKVDAILRIGLAATKWGALCVIVWRLGLAVEVLAGKSTLANFGLFLIGDLKANNVVSHLIMAMFGAGGVTYGLRERSQKRKEVKRLGSRVVDLERRFDPKRSSSGIKADGSSRPEDEP